MARTASRKKVSHEKGKTPDYAAIGEMLHDTRSSYGLTCEQVAVTLHVKPAIILALEKGRLEDIPGGVVYAKGHLRTYTQFLGINLTTMLNLLSTEAEVKPVASVSSAYNEPRRTRLAAVLSLLAMLLAGAVWYVFPTNGQQPQVSLVKPVPDELNAHLDAIESVMLSSPCIKETAHMGWPTCYSEQDDTQLRQLQDKPLISVMQVK